MPLANWMPTAAAYFPVEAIAGVGWDWSDRPSGFLESDLESEVKLNRQMEKLVVGCKEPRSLRDGDG